MGKSAEDQAIEFFIKRAQLASETADHHVRDGEFDKGAKLYRQAYGFFLKAQKNHPDDQELAILLQEVKKKYQDSIQKSQASTN
ncbi:MAG: hypothetical protein DRO88_05955 [Promethearchaeia archaeon]|nr:MAG: hypothetical protein DRO88_05955 [Candidatus Lokiarchaeia archaeon]